MLTAKLFHLIHLAGEVVVVGGLMLFAVTDTIGAALIAATASVINTILIVYSRREQRREIRQVVTDELESAEK